MRLTLRFLAKVLSTADGGLDEISMVLRNTKYSDECLNLRKLVSTARSAASSLLDKMIDEGFN